MKNMAIILQVLITLLFLQSCEEYEMVQYGEGNEINFMADYYLGKEKKPYWVDETEYLHYETNFGINPRGDSLLLVLFWQGIKISGVPADHPRRCVHHEKLGDNTLEIVCPEEYYVPADTGVAVFKVLIKRPEKRNTEYSAYLTFDYEKSDFKAGTVERQTFELRVENSVNLELWGSSQEEWDGDYAMFFGDYSETKARYLITKYGGTVLNEWTMTNQFYDVLYSNGFYLDFEEYKADPDNAPLIDENTGEWIEIPDISELL